VEINYIEEKVKEVVAESSISCSEALKLATRLDCEPSKVGEACNKLGIKIINCSLGCF